MRRQRRISLAGDEPRRPVIGVTIALVVHGNNIHQNDVPGCGREVAEADAHRWKHAATERISFHLFINAASTTTTAAAAAVVIVIIIIIIIIVVIFIMIIVNIIIFV